VNKRALVPGAAFFEMALAAACSLCTGPAAVALAAATISAPCILASANPVDGSWSEQTLECAAYFGPGGPSAKVGALEIRSCNGGSGSATAGGSETAVTSGLAHLSCVVIALAPPLLFAEPAPSASSTVRALAAAIFASQLLRSGAVSHKERASSTVATMALPISCAGVILSIFRVRP
jgi:hypothetical protein